MTDHFASPEGRETRDELREIGEQLKVMRGNMRPDSPLQGVAFELAALVGKLEAEIASKTSRGGSTPETPHE